jgi:hypothetical protein
MKLEKQLRATFKKKGLQKQYNKNKKINILFILSIHKKFLKNKSKY